MKAQMLIFFQNDLGGKCYFGGREYGNGGMLKKVGGGFILNFVVKRWVKTLFCYGSLLHSDPLVLKI